ncbi:hypothetical protein D1N57_20655, partial [Clostridioides difficile]
CSFKNLFLSLIESGVISTNSSSSINSRASSRVNILGGDNFIAQGPGVTMGYSLNALSDRAVMFVDPGVEVYEGMIIGMNSRK